MVTKQIPINLPAGGIVQVQSLTTINPALDPTKGAMPSPDAGLPSASGASFSDMLKGEIQQISNQWNKTNNDASLLVPSMPKQMRELFELQTTVNHLQFQVNTASRIGDTAANSIKRLQQAQG